MTDPFAEQLLNYMPTLRKQVERIILSRKGHFAREIGEGQIEKAGRENASDDH